MEQSEQDTVPAERSARAAPAETAAPGPGPGVPVFSTENVSIWYGSFKAVTDVSLPIYENEITAFIGSSGSGKTTVLRAFNRMNDLVPGARVDGKIDYRGQSLYGPGVSPIAVRRRIGMVFQKPNPFPKSIYDNVAYGPRINGERNRQKTRRDRGTVAAPGGVLLGTHRQQDRHPHRGAHRARPDPADLRRPPRDPRTQAYVTGRIG